MNLNFEVTGTPKGQPRPRAFARKMGSKFVARVYDSDVADEWKGQVDRAINQAAEGWTLIESEPIQVIMNFYIAHPKSHFRSNGELKATAPRNCTAKPDIDNLAKLVLDRITRSGKIWRDDAQVYSITITKFYCQPSGCDVSIYGGSDELVKH